MNVLSYIPKTFILLVTLGLSNHVLAQGPPIFVDTPIMLGLEGRGIRTFANIVSKENENAYIHAIAFPYNVTNKWQVGFVAPFVSKSPDGTESRSGFGDLQIFTKYQLFQTDGKAKTFRGLLKVAEIFPTGNSSEIPALGTGANQTVMSLVVGYVTTKYGFYSEVGYNVVGEQLPNRLLYGLAFGYPLLPQTYPPKQLNIFLELQGNYISDDIGNTVFFSPGLQFIASRKVLFESGIQLPIDEAAPAGQHTNFLLRMGTRILLF